jgi:hypothetical protein
MGLLGPRTACALLVLAAATGARGSNEYFPENVAVRKFPPARPPAHPRRFPRSGSLHPVAAPGRRRGGSGNAPR